MDGDRMKMGKNGPGLRRRVVLAMLPVGLVAACSPGADGTTSANGTASARRAGPSVGSRTAPGASTHVTTTAPDLGTTRPPTGPMSSSSPTPVPTAEPNAVIARYTGLSPTRWGMSMPGITTVVPVAGAAPTLALTFDACGGPGGSRYDATLVQLLRSHHVPATLFLNQRWIKENPRTADDLISDPLFAIENHGTQHRPLSVTGRSAYGIRGTRSAAEVVDEVWTNHEYLRSLSGRAPTWFRSGTAWYDDVAVQITRALGSRIAGFAVNGDAGATASPGQVSLALRTAPTGSIVIMHMNHPGHGTRPGLADALPRLLAAATRFVHLT
ncbi:MAG: polysaccharide deacetylase family protein [Terracoccus sp.]